MPNGRSDLLDHRRFHVTAKGQQSAALRNDIEEAIAEPVRNIHFEQLLLELGDRDVANDGDMGVSGGRWIGLRLVRQL
jgi:hypothetical protein